MSVLLQFDTVFWGRAIWLAKSVTAAEPHQGDAMWLLVPVDDVEQAREATRRGWVFMDIRVELELTVENLIPWRTPIRTREWREGDLPRLVELARKAHRITRFYADPNLPDERCDDLYEGWIKNSCAGWAQAVFVTEDGDSYVTVHRDENKGSIGLIAVAEDKRGRGVGASLVERAIEWADEQDLDAMTVVTQGRNTDALRLFERCGFRVKSMSLWFHRWYRGATA